MKHTSEVYSLYFYYYLLLCFILLQSSHGHQPTYLHFYLLVLLNFSGLMTPSTPALVMSYHLIPLVAGRHYHDTAQFGRRDSNFSVNIFHWFRPEFQISFEEPFPKRGATAFACLRHTFIDTMRRDVIYISPFT